MSSPFLRAQNPRSKKYYENLAVKNFLAGLSEAERIAQVFLVNIEGNKSFYAVESVADVTGDKDDEERPLIPGGCLFFSYNIGDSARETLDFNGSIMDFCRRHDCVPPYLAVDQEGGLVTRLKDVASYLPSASRVARSLTPAQAEELYANQALQLRALGFSMNLAPVAESITEENGRFLGLRSYGPVPETVVYSMAAIRGYERNGVGAVFKHFPGNTNTDPHTGLPEITMDRRLVSRFLLDPARIILRAEPSALLMSHARVSALDPGTPACLSAAWIKDTLQKGMRYQGLIISDDIFMAALAQNGFPPGTAAVMALEAGVDVIMLSEKRFSHVIKVFMERSRADMEFADRLFDAERKVILYKIEKGILSFEELPDGTLRVSVPDGTGLDAEKRLEDFRSAFSRGVEMYDRWF